MAEKGHGSTLRYEENIYTGLPPSVSSHGIKLGLQAWSTKRKGVVQSFLKRHLPAKRLLADQDNISHSQVPLVNPSHKKRFNLTKQRRKKLSRKECKGMKMFKIPKENQRYQQHVVLHQAWRQYMEELIPSSSLNSPGAMQAACQKLLKAELQGSMLKVQRSKCPSYVGISGIVLQESRHTFNLITPNDTVKCVPKMNCVFALELSGHIFSIHGNHFKVRAGERSSKKFKSKPTIDL